jgi:hypothetical protein
LNYVEFESYFKSGFDSYEAEYLARLFFDYIKKQSIGLDNILSIYPKNFFNDGAPEIYASISDYILIMTYVRPNKEGPANTINIRIVKKSRIKDIEYAAKSDRSICEIYSYKLAQLDISFDSGNPLSFANMADSSERWAYKYNELILHFMANI